MNPKPLPYELYLFEPPNLSQIKQGVETILNTPFKPVRQVYRLRNFDKSTSTPVFSNIVKDPIVSIDNLKPDTFYVIQISKQISEGKFSKIFTGLEMTNIPMPVQLKMIKLNEGKSEDSDYFLSFDLPSFNQQDLETLNATIVIKNALNNQILSERKLEHSNTEDLNNDLNSLMKNINDKEKGLYLSAEISTNRNKRASKTGSIIFNTDTKHVIKTFENESVQAAIRKDKEKITASSNGFIRNLQLLRATTDSLVISWDTKDANANSEFDYWVEIVEAIDDATNGDGLTTTLVDPNSIKLLQSFMNPFTIQNLSPATTYNVKVLAYPKGVEPDPKISQPTHTSMTTKLLTTLPILILNPEIISTELDSVTVKWENSFLTSQVSGIEIDVEEITTTKVIGNIEYFAADKNQNEGDEGYTRGYRLDQYQSSFLISSLPAGRVFNIKLTLIDIKGQPGPFTQIITTTKIPPIQESTINLDAEINDKSVTVSWTAPSYLNEDSNVSKYILNLIDDENEVAETIEVDPEETFVKFRSLGMYEKYVLELSTVLSFEDIDTKETESVEGK